METYQLKTIEVQAIKWTGTNEDYEALRDSPIGGKIQQYIQPAQTLIMASANSARGVSIAIGTWIVIFEDGSYAFYDEANFNAKFELATVPAVPPTNSDPSQQGSI